MYLLSLNYVLYSDACSINLGSSVILTGGRFFLDRVSEYSESGFSRYLPQLLQGRFGHGCSYFENEEGVKVDIDSNSCGLTIFQTFLVTGGADINYDFLSSTELLTEGSSNWIFSGELPSPCMGLRGANIDQRVIMAGNK